MWAVYCLSINNNNYIYVYNITIDVRKALYLGPEPPYIFRVFDNIV
jgi:hypothetical protein